MKQGLLITLLLVLALPFLVACGTPATAQQAEPTPTPLPPDPALERPTYTVQRGTIERPLDITGRVTPIDLVRLSFKVEGRVVKLNARRGDAVKAGAVLAELEQEEALDALRQAENALAQAQRDLQNAQAQQTLQVQQAELGLTQAQQDAARAQQDKAGQVQQAQSTVAQAQQTLDEAAQQHADQVKQAELALERARAALARLSPGGADDQVKLALDALAKAQQDAEATKTAASTTKTEAEAAVLAAGAAVQAAQHEYTKAFWNNNWVEQYGTDPSQPTTPDPVTGEAVPNELTDAQKAEYKQALVTAQRALEAAERNVEAAKRTLELARQAEIDQNALADKAVAEAQAALDKIWEGPVAGDAQIAAAQQAVQDAELALAAAKRQPLDRSGVQSAQLALEQARRAAGSSGTAIQNAELGVEAAQQGSFNAQQTAVEEAQYGLEKARKDVDAGRIIASQDGQVIAVGIGEGDTAEAFEPLVEIADPSRLEIGAELSAEQMRQLAEGQPATISLLARPDVLMPATIRRLPAPYGAGGSGAVQEQDKSTRFEISDLRGQSLTAGGVAKIRIVLEKKENVLWLPPEAIRSFEGRRFVVVKQGERERRAPVRIGIETPERVEILEGVKPNDVVIGQ